MEPEAGQSKHKGTRKKAQGSQWDPKDGQRERNSNPGSSQREFKAVRPQRVAIGVQDPEGAQSSQREYKIVIDSLESRF